MKFWFYIELWPSPKTYQILRYCPFRWNLDYWSSFKLIPFIKGSLRYLPFIHKASTMLKESTFVSLAITLVYIVDVDHHMHLCHNARVDSLCFWSFNHSNEIPFCTGMMSLSFQWSSHSHVCLVLWIFCYHYQHSADISYRWSRTSHTLLHSPTAIYCNKVWVTKPVRLLEKWIIISWVCIHW